MRCITHGCGVSGGLEMVAAEWVRRLEMAFWRCDEKCLGLS